MQTDIQRSFEDMFPLDDSCSLSVSGAVIHRLLRKFAPLAEDVHAVRSAIEKAQNSRIEDATFDYLDEDEDVQMGTFIFVILLSRYCIYNSRKLKFMNKMISCEDAQSLERKIAMKTTRIHKRIAFKNNEAPEFNLARFYSSIFRVSPQSEPHADRVALRRTKSFSPLT